MGLKSQEKVFSIIDRAIEIFSEQIKDPNLTQEARDNLNDRIERMVDKAIQTDSGFKKWMVGLVWVGVGGGALALAGTNPEVRKAALKLLNKSKPI
ncbi:hypothetical protein [Lederbergia citri]|nr:hypothetical protein [Lederbergia citri]